MKYINEEMIKSRMDMAGFSEEYINHLIGNLPPYYVIEVKHGEWELQEINEDHEYEWVCSECKERNDVKTNFCHNCGADMRGETE